MLPGKALCRRNKVCLLAASPGSGGSTRWLPPSAKQPPTSWAWSLQYPGFQIPRRPVVNKPLSPEVVALTCRFQALRRRHLLCRLRPEVLGVREKSLGGTNYHQNIISLEIRKQSFTVAPGWARSESQDYLGSHSLISRVLRANTTDTGRSRITVITIEHHPSNSYQS